MLEGNVLSISLEPRRIICFSRNESQCRSDDKCRSYLADGSLALCNELRVAMNVSKGTLSESHSFYRLLA